MNSRYPTVKDAILANGEDTFDVPGSHHTMRLSLLDGGPNENGGPSLIPQANVIMSASYPDSMRPGPANYKIEFGQVIHVEGFGCYRIVQDRVNRDWPKLVPIDGDRYYVKFTGGDRYDILDSHQDGSHVAWDEVSAATKTLFDGGRPLTRAQANAVAAYLSAKVEAPRERHIMSETEMCA